VPDGAKTPAPTVIMAHGFACLKEMYLDKYAEVFVNDGFGVLVYDNRCFGASDGEPRQ
jgi:pimeloyl-ACP methyl ester carboxylesterase